ncbi:hypothetical protein HAX54_013468 [Datura stramonium]|uniref:Uncharacterized protein n=1 Tax=Datura stramonium TaxID=4076 RepID=A0ABS8TN43_DATST|nr:hypothetical protein [Datura stramonium]
MKRLGKKTLDPVLRFGKFYSSICTNEASGRLEDLGRDQEEDLAGSGELPRMLTNLKKAKRMKSTKYLQESGHLGKKYLKNGNLELNRGNGCQSITISTVGANSFIDQAPEEFKNALSWLFGKVELSLLILLVVRTSLYLWRRCDQTNTTTGTSKTQSASPPPSISRTNRSCQIPTTVSVFWPDLIFPMTISVFQIPATVCFQLSANCKISRFAMVSHSQIEVCCGHQLSTEGKDEKPVARGNTGEQPEITQIQTRVEARRWANLCPASCSDIALTISIELWWCSDHRATFWRRKA